MRSKPTQLVQYQQSRSLGGTFSILISIQCQHHIIQKKDDALNQIDKQAILVQQCSSISSLSDSHDNNPRQPIETVSDKAVRIRLSNMNSDCSDRYIFSVVIHSIEQPVSSSISNFRYTLCTVYRLSLSELSSLSHSHNQSFSSD